MEDPFLRIFQFNNLKSCAGIRHGVFSRAGGLSQSPFDSLNVGRGTDDDLPAVLENRKRITLHFGMKPVIYLKQLHSDTIKLIKKKNNDLAVRFEPGNDIYTADGVITDIPGIFLAIQVADCQSVMMFDPVNKVIANIHSGWKGSIKNIIGRCIEQMNNGFGSRPADIIAGISPSLGPCCAEFMNYKTEIPGCLWQYRMKHTVYFDFWQMSMDQLIETGVQAKNIENMNICTRCNAHDFFSYRKARQTGRFACVIGMM